MNDLVTSLTGAQRLLLDLLSSRPGALPGPQEEIQWDEFLRLVGGLGLAPFTSWILQEDAHGVPNAAREQILGGGRTNTLRQMRRHAALRRIAEALEESQSPLLILKGMALAYLAYPNPYCRSMADIDLLVPRALLGRAVEVVRHLGFREWRMAFRQDCPAFASPDRLVHIEIHGSVPSLERFGVDSESLWDRSRSASLGGIPVRVLCPEDSLLHLCLHIGPHHNYMSRLQGLLDLRLYLERYGAEMDWQAVAQRSLQTDSSAWVYLTLWLAQELLGAPVPATFFQSCPAPRRLHELSRVATRLLFSFSNLPVISSFVQVCVGRSFKQRWGALAEHWRAARSRAGADDRPPETPSLGTGEYLGLFLRRMTSLVRAGALRPSAWKAAAGYQGSIADLQNLIDHRAQITPGPRGD